MFKTQFFIYVMFGFILFFLTLCKVTNKCGKNKTKNVF